MRGEENKLVTRRSGQTVIQIDSSQVTMRLTFSLTGFSRLTFFMSSSLKYRFRSFLRTCFMSTLTSVLFLNDAGPLTGVRMRVRMRLVGHTDEQSEGNEQSQMMEQSQRDDHEE